MRLQAAKTGCGGDLEPLIEMIRSIEQRTATDVSALPAERAPGGWGDGELAEQESSPAAPATVSSGWAEVDRALVGGGLGRGAVHEWFATCEPKSASHAPPIHSARPCRPVVPGNAPLCIFVHLARRALIGHQAPNGWAVWIGRQCWPHPRVLVRCSDDDARLLHCSLFVDPPDDAQRLWAIDVALRCAAVAVVIADGSRLDMAATRRLQLAARAGNTFGLIARPVSDLTQLSVAATRWLVQPTPSPTKQPRWSVQLLRAKTLRNPNSAIRNLLLEWDGAKGNVITPADVVDRSGEPAPAARAGHGARVVRKTA